jgi:hypothetical protein
MPNSRRILGKAGSMRSIERATLPISTVINAMNSRPVATEERELTLERYALRVAATESYAVWHACSHR